MTTSTAQILQCARLKRRATVENIAASSSVSDPDGAMRVLVEDGLLAEAKGRVKLTETGKAELERLLAEERASVNSATLADLYEEFTGFNTELKRIITHWQLVDGERPNDHRDPAYDAKVVDALTELHGRFGPLLQRIVSVAPRLCPYPGRFDGAVERIGAEDHSWVAGPLKDSYHTVWFELHEELIGLAGMSRETEAAAGRAE